MNDPHDAGRLAAALGDKASDNPYPEDSEEHGAWEADFYHAREVDDDGEFDDDR